MNEKEYYLVTKTYTKDDWAVEIVGIFESHEKALELIVEDQDTDIIYTYHCLTLNEVLA